jgi:AAHS family 3-hydroxyphenylpropionic acid transporter
MTSAVTTSLAATGKPSRNSVTLGLCFLAAIVEGYDTLAAGVVATKFGPDFHLNASLMGLVFSSNIFGLLVGAAIGGRIADRWGRKWVLILSMAAFGLFSITSALAATSSVFILMRFFTGLGLGGAQPNFIALAAEAGAAPTRVTRVTAITSGLPVGGIVANGILIAQPGIDWRTIFYIGGVGPIVLAALMALALPESQAFLKEKVEWLKGGLRESATRALFGADRRAATTLLWVSSFFATTALYLLLNWLPSLLVGQGYSRPEAAKVSLFFNVGGAVGGFILGYLTDRSSRKAMILGSFLVMACAVLALAVIPHNLGAAIMAGAVAGAFVIGTQFLLYGLTPNYYPATARATGVGAFIAIGRLGAVVGPLLAGALLSHGGHASDVLLAMLPLIGIACLAASILIWSRIPRHD